MRRFLAALKDFWANPPLPPLLAYQRAMMNLSIVAMKMELERLERRKKVLIELDRFWIDV